MTIIDGKQVPRRTGHGRLTGLGFARACPSLSIVYSFSKSYVGIPKHQIVCMLIVFET